MNMYKFWKQWFFVGKFHAIPEGFDVDDNDEGSDEDDDNLDFGDTLSDEEETDDEDGDSAGSAAGDADSDAGDSGDSGDTGGDGDSGDEAEGEAEDDEAGEDPEGDGEDAGKAGRSEQIMIPKSRYDTKAAQLRKAEEDKRTLEAKLAELESKQRTSDAQIKYDEAIAPLEEKLADAIADNDRDAIIKIQRDIRTAEREYAQAQVTEDNKPSGLSPEELVARVKVDALYDKLEENPALNPDREGYNEELVTDINALRDTYMTQGFDEYQAVTKAVKVLAPEALADKPKTPVQRRQQAQKKQNIDKKLDAAKRNAPDLDGDGLDSDKLGAGGDKEIDVSKLTDEEFDALPESTIRRLQGDFL